MGALYVWWGRGSVVVARRSNLVKIGIPPVIHRGLFDWEEPRNERKYYNTCSELNRKIVPFGADVQRALG